MRSLFIIFILISFVSCTNAQPTFTKEYIQKQKGKSNITVPKVQELFHIICAITQQGINDSDMINHDGAYYKAVLKQFLPYANEPLVLAINKELKGGLFYGSRYARLKMDACGFYFSENKIVKDSTYPQLNWDNKNYLEAFTQQLEEFAIKTEFQKFYQQHQLYYDTLINLMQAQMPVNKMWHWLEQRFTAQYDNYWITFSPLANGQHSTNRFEANGFKQCVMFICGPFEDSLFSPNIQEGLMSKVAFTEIDHNYVNPVTDSFKTMVNDIFSNRGKWTAGKSSNGYKSPVAVFNEYMTYATFVLYVHDNFSPTDFEKLYQRITNQMVNGRGFIKFKLFADCLLKLYLQQPQPSLISEIYPTLLEELKKVEN